MVDAHSELMGAYPWGWTTPAADALQPSRTARRTAGGRLVFSEPRGWTAVVGAHEQPLDAATGPDFRGPQEPAGDLPDGRPGTAALRRQRAPARARAAGCATRWTSRRAARDALDRGRRLGGRAGPRERRAAGCPGRPGRCARGEDRQPRATWLPDAGGPARRPLLQQGIEWSKQNLADSVQAAEGLRCAGPTRASSTRRPLARCRARASSAPASPTTRGCSHRRRVHGLRGRGRGAVRADRGPPTRAARREPCS